jgi:D-threo-aldose 1-dehydrogenase
MSEDGSVVGPTESEADARSDHRKYGAAMSEHRSAVGPTESALPRIGFGCAPLGNLFRTVTDDDAQAALQLAYERGVRLFDTAPLYGMGLAETRLGRAMVSWDRTTITLSTKVGRIVESDGPVVDAAFVELPHPNRYRWDFTRDGVLRSIEDSCRRLGVDRLDMVHVHDPDAHEADALRGAFPALIELRDQGVIGAVGCGMNQFEMLSRFVQQVDLDVILLAGRWTLLDRTGESLLNLCGECGVQVMCGGVFNSGLLANPVSGSTFNYTTAPQTLVRQAQQLALAAERNGSTLAADAIAFPFTHPMVASVLLGMRSVSEVDANLTAARSMLS